MQILKSRQTSTGTAALFTEVGLLIKKRLQHALTLSFAQFQVLWFVAEHQRANMQDVAAYFKITAPSATSLVDELVRGKYLVRHASTSDRRKIELTLTPKGKKEFTLSLHKRKKILDSIFKPLSGADRAELNRILKKIITHI